MHASQSLPFFVLHIRLLNSLWSRWLEHGQSGWSGWSSQHTLLTQCPDTQSSPVVHSELPDLAGDFSGKLVFAEAEHGERGELPDLAGDLSDELIATEIQEPEAPKG